MLSTSCLAIALAMATILCQQDPATQGKAQEASAKRALIEATVIKSLRNTPGLSIHGDIDRDSPFAGLGIGPSIGGGLIGKFRASIDKTGTVYAVVNAEDGKLEMWRSGKKTAQRFTWSGRSTPKIGNVAAELLRLLDFERVGRRLNDADDVKKIGTKTIGDKQCQGYSAVFEPDLVESDGGGGMMRLAVEEVEVKFWLDAETGAFVRADFNIIQGLPAGIRIGIGGGGEAQEMKFETLYSLVADKVDAELEHKIPAEIRRRLGR